MRTTSTLFIISFMLLVSPLLAQESVMNLPQKYLMPLELPEPMEIGGKKYYYEPPAPNDRPDERYWYVWSDRVNNPTYTSADGSTVKERLEFLRPLAVLEVRGNRLRVACKKDIRNGMLPAGRSDLGWIDHDRLLLWFRGMRSLPHQIEKKTMIINVFDPANPGQDYPQIYREPTLPGQDAARQGIETVRNYEILLVFKETEHDYLVGSRFMINTRDTTNVRDVISGWVPKSQATPWNHRTGIEWDWQTSPDRIRANNLARLWLETDNMPRAAHYTQEDENKPYVRQPGPFDRYAILDDEADEEGFDFTRPIRIGYVGGIYAGELGRVDDDFIRSLQMATHNITEKLRNINIIFVIDATYSMEIYSEPVAQALATVMQTINEREQLREPNMRKQYRFGALVFRDDPEQHIIHYSNQGQLTQDTQVINAFLKEKMDPKYNVLSPDLPESMFYGIEQAMQIFGPNPEQTNYTIIIGDAGDHQNQQGKPRTFRTAEEVVGELAAVNSHVIAYQVFHNQRINPVTGLMVPADTIFETFQTQLKHVVKETARSIALAQTDGSRTDNIRWAETAPNRFSLQNARITGELVVPNVNDSIPMSMLEELLVDRIDVIDTITNLEIRNLRESFFRGQTGDVAGMERSIHMIMETMAELGYVDADAADVMELIQTIVRDGQRQYYRELYTYYQYDDLSWFQPVVLISHSYLHGMVRNIRQLSDIRNLPPIQRRNSLIRIWDNMITAFLGETDRETKEGITADQIQRWMSGVQVDALWGEITYNDLHDPQRFTNEDMLIYADAYSAAYNRLRRVYEENVHYEGFITGSDSQFLWVPASIFP